jgi:phosphoribosylaminoimidazolecarboxamide formyltransferase/IMP cyclohydrolase
VYNSASNSAISLRYGCNPHQTPAQVYSKSGNLPLRVLNGDPSYINFLDALNSWQLVKELNQATNLPAAASFKHVSPTGAAVAVPLSDTLRRAYLVDDIELSPLAISYARARGTDRVSSFGDWVAVSNVVDLPTAKLLRREVSDGIIAPGYEDDALALLQKKKNGTYRIFEIDPSYEPVEIETRDVFGITLEQKRNNQQIDQSLLRNVVTEAKDISREAQRDLLVSYITLKYTQSNSVCFAFDGQTIGVGAGQQSRIHCTRLAASKARTWYLRQHPAVLELPFKHKIARPTQDNAVDQYVNSEDGTLEAQRELFQAEVAALPTAEKQLWLSNLQNIAMGSDGYIPFCDNIDEAHQWGVKYLIQPGGSLRDQEVIQACNEYGMVMVCSGLRLFHH